MRRSMTLTLTAEPIDAGKTKPYNIAFFCQAAHDVEPNLPGDMKNIR